MDVKRGKNVCRTIADLGGHFVGLPAVLEMRRFVMAVMVAVVVMIMRVSMRFARRRPQPEQQHNADQY